MIIMPRLAPELDVGAWLNTDTAPVLADLRGRVVLIEAFQMLCPACVSHALPQAQRASRLFAAPDLAVIGLHTVFEHHDAQGPRVALEAFLHENRISFPVAIDSPGDGTPLPATMSAYKMQGTPTLILVDRYGSLRKQKFGVENDMTLGAEIMALVREPFENLSAQTETKRPT